jgi:hypothetical protein
MRIINVRMNSALWRRMSREKDKLDMNWDEYITHLFGFKCAFFEVMNDKKDYEDFLREIGVDHVH